MKDFNSLSGPWIGFSVQDAVRISERLLLLIVNGSVSGTGEDKDGKFEVAGHYYGATQELRLIRHYTWTTEPSQVGVGILYEYVGAWDGDLAFGNWSPLHDPEYGGPFEMWPEQEEETISEAFEIEHREPAALGSSLMPSWQSR
jgi:hypothetical protein